MRRTLRKRSAAERDIDRRLRKLPFAALRSPSYADLKRDISIEQLVAHLLKEEPEFIRGEHRWHCPFHRARLRREDATPSFAARDEKRRWFCNPCGISGDCFDLLTTPGYKEMNLKQAFMFLRNHRDEFVR
jgi:hypothetical protein